MKKLNLIVIAFLLIFAVKANAQSRGLAVGDVQLRLGASRDFVVKALSEKYRLNAVSADSYMVVNYDGDKKLYETLGSVGFDNGLLSSISRSLDTSAWPDDEGYSTARAINDAISGSIPVTDADGAKRATIKVVTSSNDVTAGGMPVGLKTLMFYVNDRQVMVLISDGPHSQKSVSVSISIRTKPW